MDTIVKNILIQVEAIYKKVEDFVLRKEKVTITNPEYMSTCNAISKGNSDCKFQKLLLFSWHEIILRIGNSFSRVITEGSHPATAAILKNELIFWPTGSFC